MSDESSEHLDEIRFYPPEFCPIDVAEEKLVTVFLSFGRMCCWNHAGEWICEKKCAACEDTYFQFTRRPMRPFRPPSLRQLLLELLQELDSGSAIESAQGPIESAHHRAPPIERASDIGTTAPCPAIRPLRAQVSAVN